MSSIKKNIFYSSIYQVLLVLLPLITSPYISRVLGANNIGIYSYSQSIAKYFFLFCLLGVTNYGNRSCAKAREDKDLLSSTFWSIYAFQFIVSVIFIGLYIIFLLVFVKENNLIFILQILFVFSAASDISWLFFGLEQFKITVARNVIVKLISVVFIFMFVKNGNDLWKYTFILSGSFLANQIIMWPFLKRFVYFVKPSWRQILVHIKPNLVLFLPVIAMSVYRVMDKVMLGTMSTMTQSGYFENSEKMINIPQGLITAIGTVMLPRMSNLAMKNEVEKSNSLMEKSMTFVMFISIALAFGLAGISKVFTPLFFGDGFIDCIVLIMTLSPVLIFMSWTNVLRTHYLIPNDLDKAYTSSIATGAVVNIIVNYLLIPKMGALGAIIGTLCAEGSVCIVQTFIVSRYLDIKKYLRNTLGFIPIGLCMFLVVRFIGEINLSAIVVLLLQISAGAMIYLSLAVGYVYMIQRELVLMIAEPISSLLKRKWK